MDQNLNRADLLPESISTGLLLALAVFGIAAWVVSHWALRRYGSNKFGLWVRALIGVIPGTAAWWLSFQALSRFVFFQTSTSLPVLSVVGGMVLEAVSAFYVHEGARIPPRVARVLVACRMAAVSAVLFMLAQPVVLGERERDVHRRAVLLIDDSSSMNFEDAQMTAEERADLEEALGEGGLPAMTRYEMVRRLLAVRGENNPFRSSMRNLTVDLFRFGNGIEALSELEEGHDMTPRDPKEQMFRSTTDYCTALEKVLTELPAEEVSSILLMTDGRHNGPSGVGSLARRFGAYHIRVDSVVVGGTVKPFDIAIASVDAPESVFEGDKVRFTVVVRATGANGREASLVFKNDSMAILEEKKFTVDSDDWVREFKFTDTPKDCDIYRYFFEIPSFDGELFKNNNRRDIDVAVSNDRTNVLLVDDRPRWEYRYLRNLFYGRDKSVHLQDWLVHPDTIEGLPSPALPPASASREFGDSAAGGFPESLDEWRKFDIIILGDIGEDVLTPSVVDCIRTCVEERGALLVLISGSEKMPYAIRNAVFRELMPVEVEPSDESHRDAPEADFRLALASSGRAHAVMSQSASAYESEELWENLPDFHWRLPIGSVKEGTDVLAYARPKQGSAFLDAGSDAESVAAAMETDPDGALERLRRLREEQDKNALIVAAQRGKGRVMMMMTDSIWRLRSKGGDLQHHRFWGQVMRWGAGERLRVGDAHVRLGTDQLRYGPGEPIQVYARVLDNEYKGVADLPLSVILRVSGRERRIALTLREGSNGFYEGVIAEGLDRPDEYDLELMCDEIRDRLGSLCPNGRVLTKIRVGTAKRPAEDVDITSTREYAETLARETGGKVYSPADYVRSFEADHPVDSAEGTKSVRERTEFLLWSTPPLFLLVVALLTAEWILRKRVRLS